MAEKHLLNALVKGDGHIEIRILDNEEHGKSDASLLLFHGENELQVTLIDGGMPNFRATQELLDLRETLLNQLSVDNRDDYQLALQLVVTHCHIDHISELHENLIPRPEFSIESLYLPPPTAMTLDGTYDNVRNGDYHRRSLLFSAMVKHAPTAKIFPLNWAEILSIPCPCGEMTLFAPLRDYGTEEGIAKLLSSPKASKEPELVYATTPVRVVNANCLWAYVSCNGKSALFCGDTLKTCAELSDEPFDLMVEAYAERVKSDIIKYPHHGIKRPDAAPGIKRMLKEGGVAVLAVAGANECAGKALDALNVAHVNTEDGTCVFHLK